MWGEKKNNKQIRLSENTRKHQKMCAVMGIEFVPITS